MSFLKKLNNIVLKQVTKSGPFVSKIASKQKREVLGYKNIVDMEILKQQATREEKQRFGKEPEQIVDHLVDKVLEESVKDLDPKIDDITDKIVNNLFTSRVVELKEIQFLTDEVSEVLNIKRKPLKKGEKVQRILPSLKELLNQNLLNQLFEDMANFNAPINRNYLRYKTGRFARSAKVGKITHNERTKQLSIYYDYLRRPYQVFDPNKGKEPWSSKGRDPNRYIQEAVLEITKKGSFRSLAKDIIIDKIKFIER